jgi:SET domain-containing protein
VLGEWGIKIIMSFINKTYIDISNIHGYGVFAFEDIKKDSIVISHPIIQIKSKTPLPHELNKYLFTDNGGPILILGNASYINFSNSPNAYCKVESLHGIINILSYKDISKGDEITLNYT